MANLANRVVPSVWTQIINKVTYSVTPNADVIAMVGPASNGPLGEVLTFSSPANALKTLGPCRMVNQMFAAWAGGAGQIKVVRIGGTENFDSVLYQDDYSSLAASPDDVHVYDITDYMNYRYNDLEDFMDAVSGNLSPDETPKDRFGEATNEDVIFLVSDEKFDSIHFEMGTTPGTSAQMEIGYYNADETQTGFSNNLGFSKFPLIEIDDTQITNSRVSMNRASGFIEWDLEDVDDWQQTSFTDDDGVEHSGYIVALRVTAVDAGNNHWNFKRICKRIGAEAPYLVLNGATFDGTTGYVTGAGSTPVLMIEGKTASTDTVTVGLKRVGPKVYVFASTTDPVSGNEVSETFIISPSYAGSPDNEYQYDTTDFVEEVNETSTIIQVTDISGSGDMFGWTPTGSNTITDKSSYTLSGGSANVAALALKDYVNGLGKLSREADIYSVLPVIPEDVIETSSGGVDNDLFLAIMQVFYTDITNLSSGLNQKPRFLWSWLSPGYQNVGTISADNLNIKAGSARRLGQSDRVAYLIQKLGFPELEGTGSLAYRREYLAAFTAGLISALPPAVPGTRKPLSIGAVDVAYNYDELDVLIRQGVLAYADVPGIGVCIGKAITTKLNHTLSAISARRVSDRIAIDTTAMLEARFIGRANESGVIKEIEKNIIAYLEAQIAPAAVGGLINSFGSVVVVPDQVNANKVRVAYDLVVKSDLDLIDQSIYLTNSIEVAL